MEPAVGAIGIELPALGSLCAKLLKIRRPGLTWKSLVRHSRRMPFPGVPVPVGGLLALLRYPWHGQPFARPL